MTDVQLDLFEDELARKARLREVASAAMMSHLHHCGRCSQGVLNPRKRCAPGAVLMADCGRRTNDWIAACQAAKAVARG